MVSFEESNNNNHILKSFDCIIKHSELNRIILQLSNFGILENECALDLLHWICFHGITNPTQNIALGHALHSTFIKVCTFFFCFVKVVCNVTDLWENAIKFVKKKHKKHEKNIIKKNKKLCDEYQLEGNEFKVELFEANLTNEDIDDEESSISDCPLSQLPTNFPNRNNAKKNNNAIDENNNNKQKNHKQNDIKKTDMEIKQSPRIAIQGICVRFTHVLCVFVLVFDTMCSLILLSLCCLRVFCRFVLCGNVFLSAYA